MPLNCGVHRQGRTRLPHSAAYALSFISCLTAWCFLFRTHANNGGLNGPIGSGRPTPPLARFSARRQRARGLGFYFQRCLSSSSTTGSSSKRFVRRPAAQPHGPRRNQQTGSERHSPDVRSSSCRCRRPCRPAHVKGTRADKHLADGDLNLGDGIDAFLGNARPFGLLNVCLTFAPVRAPSDLPSTEYSYLHSSRPGSAPPGPLSRDTVSDPSLLHAAQGATKASKATQPPARNPQPQVTTLAPQPTLFRGTCPASVCCDGPSEVMSGTGLDAALFETGTGRASSARTCFPGSSTAPCHFPSPPAGLAQRLFSRPVPSTTLA